MNFVKMLLFIVAISFFTVFNLFALEALTNESIINLVKSGESQELIIHKIKTSQNQFDLSVDGILKLKTEGINEDIIRAMVIVSDENRKSKTDANEADYQNALELERDGKYDEAISKLSVLASKNTDIKYRFSHVNALLEKSREMKESDDSNWESVAKEAQSWIKTLYRNNYTNGDYWILYVKFGALIDREGEVSGGFKKLFYYKPGNIDALLLQGDIYSRLAESAKEPVKTDSNNLMSAGRDEKKYRWTVARRAYQSAVVSTGLSDEKKSEVYCKLGDIEMQAFKNKEEAVHYWNQSVSAQPDGKWAVMAQERLNKYK